MNFVEVVNGRPPNFDAIVAVFADAAKPGVIFAYGDKIYAPGRWVLTPALQAHEQIHLARQNGAPDAWWDRYLSDKDFRLDEELPAHRAEYEAYCRRHVEPRKQRVALEQIAGKLASPLYGGIITATDAQLALKG